MLSEISSNLLSPSTGYILNDKIEKKTCKDCPSPKINDYRGTANT